MIEVLGGGPIDGQLGENPDWGSISCPSGRILQSTAMSGAVQFWLVEDEQETGGILLASENYANPRGISGDSLENTNVIRALLVSLGLSGNHGFFANGFTYSQVGDAGIDVDGKIYIYAGDTPLPVNVYAGTNPAGNTNYLEIDFGASYETLRSEVVRVPSDYPTLQEAIDSYNSGANSNVQVTVLVEAGHKLTRGLSCTRGDYGRFQIASEDPTVKLDASFVGVNVEQNPTNGEVPRPPLCYGFHARMPRWNLVVDMENTHGSGLLLINCSTYVSAGNGVINAGFRGWQQRAGYGFASNTNFSGATGCAARVQKAGVCNLGDANLTFACKTEDQSIGALYVSRSCNVEARGANVSDSGGGGIVCRRSIVTAVDCRADRCARAAFEAQSGGVIDAVNSFCDSPTIEAYYSRFGATIIASGAKVTNANIPSRIFVLTDGASIVVNAGTTVDGTTVDESHLNGVLAFNTTFGAGTVSHPDKQGVVESGSNANGTWQKFSDGRMLAETGIKNIDVTVLPNEFSAQITKPTLPQVFTSVAHVNERAVGKTATGGGGSDIFVNLCSNSSATGNELKVFNTGQQIDGAATGATIQSVQLMMQVTGRWK